MSSEFVEVKKLAISILTKILIGHRDIEPSDELLAQFYHILHSLLAHREYVILVYISVFHWSKLLLMITGEF